MLNALLVTAAALSQGVLATSGGWQVSPALVCYLGAVIVLNLAQLAIASAASPAGFVVDELAAAMLRYWLVVELAERGFQGFPGALRSARRVVLGGLVVTTVFVTWGSLGMGGPRTTFRALAMATAGTGLTLLALRWLTLRYSLLVHPVRRVTMTWLGGYLLLRSLLLGAATEWSAGARVHAVALSSGAWMAWAAALAWAAWSGQRWRLPAGCRP